MAISTIWVLSSSGPWSSESHLKWEFWDLGLNLKTQKGPELLGPYYSNIRIIFGPQNLTE